MFNHRWLLEPIDNVPQVELELAFQRRKDESGLGA
jgi:hypothetical protein